MYRVNLGMLCDDSQRYLIMSTILYSIKVVALYIIHHNDIIKAILCLL